MKYSRVWDTFPTSKIEPFVTICIYKVIFCRLKILYTQYCSTGVFICVSSLAAPFCSRQLHPQASEMVFFVTITIANVIFYWAMVLHVHFLLMNFFFRFVSRRFWIHLVAGGSRLFQIILSDSSSFQVVPVCSRWFPACFSFQQVQNCNNRGTKRSQHNEISLTLLHCYYFFTIFTHYLEILSTYSQTYIIAGNINRPNKSIH